MNGIPEVLGSNALWAVTRLAEIALANMLSAPGAAFLAGVALAVYLHMPKFSLPTGALLSQEDGRSDGGRTPYQRLIDKIPNQELRERLIAEQVNSGSAGSRIEAIENLLASSLPPRFTNPPASVERPRPQFDRSRSDVYGAGEAQHGG